MKQKMTLRTFAGKWGVGIGERADVVLARAEPRRWARAVRLKPVEHRDNHSRRDHGECPGDWGLVHIDEFLEAEE
jgi:hypothetical protein